MEIEQVRDVLSSSPNFAVIIRGDRCTGKTSLLNRIRNLLTEEDWQGRYFAPLTIEPRSVRTIEDFARELWHGLGNALKDIELNSLTEIASSFKFESYSDFGKRLKHLNSQFPDVTFVVFVDEFDKVAHDIDEVEYRRIVDLVHYIVEKTEFPVQFFISLLRDLPEIYGSSIPSRRLDLKSFSRDDIDKMILGILGTYAHPNKKTLAKLYNFGGGNPYFAKMLLEKLFERCGTDITKWNLDKTFSEAVQRAAHSPEAHEVFSSIYNKYLNDDERYVVAWAASKEDCLLNMQEISEKPAKLRIALKAALKDLCERNYLLQQSDGNYRLQIALMGERFKGWSKFELELERLNVFPTSGINPAGLSPKLVSQGVCIDESTQQIYIDGQRIVDEPPDLQYRALVYLVRNVGRVVSRNELTEYLHNTDAKTDQSLDTLIHRLRDMLDDTQKPHKYLETVHGRGFRMENAVIVHTLPENN
jgi:DNA-binding winged helix-turn-helix (wHTH) protein